MMETDSADVEPLLSQPSNSSKRIPHRELRSPIRPRRLKTIGFMIILIIVPSLYILKSTSIHENQIWSLDIIHPFSSKIIIQPDIVPEGYLIWSGGCRIPDIDPFESEAMKMYKAKDYIACSKYPTFTYTETDANGDVILQLNQTAINVLKKSSESVSCCYSNITRSPTPESADTQVVYSTCIKIDKSARLLRTEEFIIVNCNIQNKKFKYKKKKTMQVHSNIQPSPEILKRFQQFKSNTSDKPWNVLMIGVDTLSRINLMRAMPKTFKHLKSHQWLDFQAYNKIDDNTFPNLMAFLTGRNNSRARERCDGKGENSPDNCDFVWKEYQNAGYVTAYGEDTIGIDTFGKPLHKGFAVPPADHYMRPLFIAAEKTNRVSGCPYYCTGQNSSGETVFSYTLQFVNKYKDNPFFGFFWTNSFSHNDIGMPASMDDKMERFLINLEETGILNNTFVWFLGDHGIRFGDMRSLFSGYYEERLPTLFISVPQKFKDMYSDLYSMMVLNTKRLSTPYDVYITLQDILRISGKKDELSPSEACPNCQSLFTPINFDRSCSDCSVTSHWCACNPLKVLPNDNEIAKRAVIYLLDTVIENDFAEVNNNTKCRLCAKLTLKKILHVYYVKNLHEEKDSEEYVVVFSVNQGNLIFESTVRHNIKTDEIVITGIVSRLTKYSGNGDCVKSAYLKKYCYCNHKCHPNKYNHHR